MKNWRIPLLAGTLVGLLFLLGFLASPVRKQIQSVESFHLPGKLRGIGPGCAGCHFNVKFALDGPAASLLSKGVHSMRQELLEHPFFTTASEDCVGCHSGVHDSWQQSAHGRSFTNPIFQHAFKRDRKAWCLNCHAPLWDPDTMDPEAIASTPDMKSRYAEGVNCSVCHIRDGAIVGPNDYSGKENELFHPVTFDPGLRSESFCAGCHQFNFVQELEPFVIYADDAVMQNTVQEFLQHQKTMPANSKGCVDCHFEPDHNLASNNGDPRPALTLKLQMRPVSDSQGKMNNDQGPGPTERVEKRKRIELEANRARKRIEVEANREQKQLAPEVNRGTNHAALEANQKRHELQAPMNRKPTPDGSSEQNRSESQQKFHYNLDWTIEMENLGHHYPTGDLFRILTLYAFDKSDREIYRYDFRKEVRVIDRAIVRDTTLKPEGGSYRAFRSDSALLQTKPVRCELVYRLQGSIEPRIAPHFQPGILRKVLYSGPCKVDPKSF